mgnify:CR=1 FL=1
MTQNGDLAGLPSLVLDARGRPMLLEVQTNPSTNNKEEFECFNQTAAFDALMRASLDEHSCHSTRNVAPAAHIDWSAKADRPHVGTQHSDCSAHLSPQSWVS